MNTHKTLIVMGRSGSGKGTQIALLKEALAQENQEVFHFETGGLFREMIKGEGYISDRLRKILSQGDLVPDFFTDWLLVDNLGKNLNSLNQTLILDGYPRTLPQVETLDTTLDFFGRSENIIVLHVEVSEDEVRKRMKERGRGDDTDMVAVENRIRFYNEKVLPSLDVLRGKDNYRVIDINGEGNIQDIQQEIINTLSTL